jgi:hypothetical protein
MGIILSPTQRMTERRKMEMRTKLFEELRKQYLADGCPEDEANARALAKVRAIKLK